MLLETLCLVCELLQADQIDKAHDFAQNDSETTLEKGLLLPGTNEDHMNCPLFLPSPKIVREPKSLKIKGNSSSVNLSKRREESKQKHGF